MKPTLETIKQSGQPYVDRPVMARMRPLTHALLTAWGYRVQPGFRIGTERVTLEWGKT